MTIYWSGKGSTGKVYYGRDLKKVLNPPPSIIERLTCYWDRVSRDRLFWRLVLGAGAVALIVAALIVTAGCNSTEKSGTPSAQASDLNIATTAATAAPTFTMSMPLRISPKDLKPGTEFAGSAYKGDAELTITTIEYDGSQRRVTVPVIMMFSVYAKAR